MGDGPLDAGRFSDWLRDAERAVAGQGEAAVPCDGCTGCCTSSQFVHISPAETATLARIPAALLFPAPLLPPGHKVLGYDERGHCPMLVDGRCSIYEDRPRACRTYDCRIFAAAGVEPDKADVAVRSRRWRFSVPAGDEAPAAAVRAAARWLGAHRDRLPERLRAGGPTALAVLAVRAHRAFLGAAEPTVEEVLAALGAG
ncbi:MAG TPA: YkgJ family cysteine cluster protein [Solirubrobacterales bacterium]|nr:YkgJ family cysteine cluster protein [Solirubrobacterales bacterium]